MKKALLLGAALMFIAGSASAQIIGMYTDDTHTSWCVESAAAQGNMVTVYIFGSPNADGMTCLEFSTTTEGGGYMAFTPTWADDIASPQMGSFPDNDLGACWQGCKDDWAWLLNATLFITSPEAMTISFGAFTGSPYIKILTCLGDEIEAYAFSNFCINQPCCPPNTAVEESSWGAIKNLYE